MDNASLRQGPGPAELHDLGDFTTTPRVITISLMATAIGFICGFVAWLLLKLISFFTYLFFFQRFSTALQSPAPAPPSIPACGPPVTRARC